MRIVIAEDDLVSRKLIERAVTHLGHSCMTAENGEEAWKLIIDKLDEGVVNLLFLLFVATEVEVGLERGLKVESHGAEACTFEVEIKLFVFF